MTAMATMTMDGKKYVIVPQKEYERLVKAVDKIPRRPLPPADAKGNREAVEFISVGISNEIIGRREALGWTQRELAKRAGMRFETLNRVERGTVTPDTRTIIKIDNALKAGEKAV